MAMQVRTDDEAETKIEETEKEKTRESAKRKQEHGNVYYKLDLQRPFFLLSFFLITSFMRVTAICQTA